MKTRKILSLLIALMVGLMVMAQSEKNSILFNCFNPSEVEYFNYFKQQNDTDPSEIKSQTPRVDHMDSYYNRGYYYIIPMCSARPPGDCNLELANRVKKQSHWMRSERKGNK